MNVKTPITKLDEQRGLQYIRERIVPVTVARWNKAVDMSRLRYYKDLFKVTKEELNKTLVKKSEYRASPTDNTRKDWILFESNPQKPYKSVKLKGPFKFSLSRDSFVGELSVAVALPGSDDWVTYYISESDELFNNTVKPIKRGVNIKESVPHADPNDPFHFSRKEEDAAVAYLKREVIPYIVNKRNVFFRSRATTKQHIELRVADVLQTLRKVKEQPTKHGLMLYYKAEGQNQIYNLGIYKDGEGDILIYNQDSGQLFPFGKKIQPYTEKDFTEGVEGKSKIGQISKMEEAMALQYIRRTLVPLTVRWWNSEYELGNTDSPVTVEEVLGGLKKTAHEGNWAGHKDWQSITYTFIRNNDETESIKFTIFNEGKLAVEIHCGFLPCLSHYEVGMKLGTKLKRYSKNSKDDFFETYDADKEREEYERNFNNALPVTKKEELAAVDYIKKVLIPIVLKHYDKYKDNHFFEPISADTIRMHLKKDAVYLDYGRPSHTVLYTAKIPSKLGPLWEKEFKFFITKNENNEIFIRWKHEFNFSAGQYVKDKHGYYTHGDVNENIINEDETGLERISPKEEKEALQYIRRYIVPMAVKTHNDANLPRNSVTEEEVLQNLKLSGRYPQHGAENPSIAFTSVPRGKYFAFMVGKQLQKKFKEFGRMYVTYRTPDIVSFNSYVVGEIPKSLNEGIKVLRAARPRVIDKMEEARALQYIRNTLIPAAFRCYNNHVMGEFAVRKEDDIRKALKKVSHDYIPKIFEEQIYFEAHVPTVGGKRVQKFEFWIRKNDRPGLENKIRAGVNIENYIGQEFNIGEPAYMS